MSKLWLLLLLSALISTGCNRVSMQPFLGYSDDWERLSSQVGPGLVAEGQSPIPDVAIPIGYTPVVSRSSSRFDEYARQVKHVYQGRSPAAEAIRFYRHQPLRDDWRFISMQEDAIGAMVLNFVKGPEQLRIRIRQLHQVTTVIVSIDPQQADYMLP